MKRFFLVGLFGLSLLLPFAFKSDVSAEGEQQADPFHDAPACVLNGSDSNLLSFPTWYKYLEGRSVGNRCNPVVEFPEGIGKIALAVVEILLRASGLVAIGFITYGGFRFLTSQGEPDGAKAARNIIINALIGTAIAILATAIVNLIGNSLGGGSI